MFSTLWCIPYRKYMRKPVIDAAQMCLQIFHTYNMDKTARLLRLNTENTDTVETITIDKPYIINAAHILLYILHINDRYFVQIQTYVL